MRKPTPAPTEHKNPPPRVPQIRRPTRDAKVATADDKDPKAIAQLAREAAALEKAGRWSEARAAYQALEKAKGYSSAEALYHQAWNAFQSNATSDAAQLAADAARLPSPFRTRAMLLYGDALFRQQEFARAKTIYLGVRKNQTGEDRSTTIKKIMACNKQLKLSEADGVED
jgi:TolA-binding protein